LKSLSAVLNALAGHYFESEIDFEMVGRIDGAVSLLYVLNDGVKVRDAKESGFNKESRPRTASSSTTYE